MSSITPTQRTLKYWRALGYDCAITEHWNSFAKIRQDLFGFIDILAMGYGQIVGIQTTSYSNHTTRRTKILGLEVAKHWLEAGGLISIMSWKTGRRPAYRLDFVTLKDFN